VAKLIQIVRPLIEGWELHWHSRREGALTAAGLEVT
jgi:hypothetical protein